MPNSRTSLTCVLWLALACAAIPRASNAQGVAAPPGVLDCAPAWLPTFGSQSGPAGGFAKAMLVHDDGTGPSLFAAGSFTTIGGADARSIGRWDGTSWHALSSGLDDEASALASFDDGSGPALYVGGEFLNAGGAPAKYIARWDGASWSALPGEFNQPVRALVVFDDGAGPALHACGEFYSVGGAYMSGVAKWTGSGWVPLPGGAGGDVHAAAVYDDGSGPALYVGGSDFIIGDAAVGAVARWNGTSWSGVGAQASIAWVTSLVAHDDGSGDALYVGTLVNGSSGIFALGLSRWNGTSWSGVGGAGSPLGVHGLAEWYDGTQNVLLVGGNIQAPQAPLIKGTARWNGTTWSEIGGGANHGPASFATYDDGTGPHLFASGAFSFMDGHPLAGMGRLDGQHWSKIGNGLDGFVYAFAEHADLGGPALYAGGTFDNVDGVPTSSVARWSGTSWTALAGVLGGQIDALIEFDDGTGPALYAGGTFQGQGAQPNGIARWNGTSWKPVGTGVDGYGWVSALAVFDDGTGPALYAAGAFSGIGGVSTHSIGRWDGQTWSAVGAGLSFSYVEALATFDDGSGPALYAGGVFDSTAAAPIKGIAKWGGTSWTEVGGGISYAVYALCTFDDGSGPALYAGGSFALAGTTPAANLARWDGTSWTAVGGGVSTSTYLGVQALCVHDDGDGPALYVGGSFTAAGGIAARGIARWNGSSWSALGDGISPVQPVRALHGFDFGPLPQLYVGGNFQVSPAGDTYIARWGCPAIATVPGCAGNAVQLTTSAKAAPLATTLPLALHTHAAAIGTAVLFVGAGGVDQQGCGAVQLPWGELLLALIPQPAPIAVRSLVAGESDLSIGVPATPSIAGVSVMLQAAAVDGSTGVATTALSNALAVLLWP